MKNRFLWIYGFAVVTMVFSLSVMGQATLKDESEPVTDSEVIQKAEQRTGSTDYSTFLDSDDNLYVIHAEQVVQLGDEQTEITSLPIEAEDGKRLIVSIDNQGTQEIAFWVYKNGVRTDDGIILHNHVRPGSLGKKRYSRSIPAGSYELILKSEHEKNHCDAKIAVGYEKEVEESSSRQLQLRKRPKLQSDQKRACCDMVGFDMQPIVLVEKIDTDRTKLWSNSNRVRYGKLDQPKTTRRTADLGCSCSIQ